MQVKNSFDKETIKKIAKGAAIAAGGAAAVALLEFFGQIEVSNPVLASFAAWFVPVAINAVKEWMRGQ